MFKQLAKPNRRKEGKKFISTLTDFDVESDSLFATPKHSDRQIPRPNTEYFSDAVLNRNGQLGQQSKFDSHTEEQDEQIQQNAKNLSYFKSKLRLDLQKMPTQSTLITATSVSNRNMRSTPMSQFSLQSNQKIDKLQAKEQLIQKLHSGNSVQSEHAQDFETEAGDHMEECIPEYKQNEQIVDQKKRKSVPTIKFDDSNQVLANYYGNVSRKQQQISKLIEVRQQTAKDKIQAQIEKISAAHDEISVITSQNSLASKNTSPLPNQHGDLLKHLNLSHQKLKSNSELVPQIKSSNDKNILEERSFSVSDLAHSQEYFNRAHTKKQKKSLFDIKLPSKQWQQLQPAQSNEHTPLAASKVQNLFPNQQRNPSFSSVTSLLKHAITTQRKNNAIKTIFQKENNTEPYQVSRKGKSVHSLLEDEGNTTKNSGSQTHTYGFMSNKSQTASERNNKSKPKKSNSRQTSPLHRSTQTFEKVQSKLNTPFAEISEKITFNIINLKKFFKNDARVYRYIQSMLSKRHDCLMPIFIKSEKKEEVFDNVVAIESNIQASVNQYEMQKKSHIMKLKQRYTESLVFIDPTQLMKELQFFFEELEKLCLHKMKDKVTKAFEVVAFTDQRVEEDLVKLAKQQKPVPLDFQKRRYLYMNQNILYISEKLEYYEKSFGEFNLISPESRILQREIEQNICQLKQIDRESRNPYRKQVIDQSKH